MPTRTPRHILCILGNWRGLDEVDAIVRQTCFAGFELSRKFSALTPDDRMPDSFDASYDRVTPSMSDEDWDAVRSHRAVAYVLSPPIPKSRAIDISGQALLLTATLLQSGGIAAKGESSGIAHGRARWLELAEEFARAQQQGDTVTEGAHLLSAWVRRPLLDSDDGIYYSCGMHLLGERDIEIESSLDVVEALNWIDLLSLYLVGDRPTRKPKNGEGFRLDDETPRRVMRFRPCQRYEEDDFMSNPYGYLRLQPDT